jgi:hypothetical protein
VQQLGREYDKGEIGGENKSGPLVYMTRRSSERAYEKRRSTVIGSHSKILSAVRFGEEARRLRLGFQGKIPGDCGPLNVHTGSTTTIGSDEGA